MIISVIIPVYKVEQYLNECIQSVFRQTFTNLEIILVDDGSPDKCPVMCDDYAINDTRVIVIHKKNGGLSDARNTGLKAATGDYVIFIDSDDYWLEVDFIQELVNGIRKAPDTDILLFGRVDYYESGQKFIQGKVVDINMVNNQSKNDVFSYLVSNQLYDMSAWTKLIRREFLISNDIFFEQGLLGEDMDWSLALWLKLEKIRAVNNHGYVYRHRTGSISSSYNYKNMSDFAYILKKWQKIAQVEMKDRMLSRLFLGYLAFLYPTLLRNFFLIKKSERNAEYNLLKELKPLLEFSMTKKSDQVAILNKYLGFRITTFVFGIFGLIRKKGFKGLKLVLRYS